MASQAQIARQNAKDGIDLAKEMGIPKRVGKNALGCEASPFKADIDQWLNEGKSYAFIAKQLEMLGGPISTKSIAKYAKHRQSMVSEKLMESPEYNRQVKLLHNQIQDGVSQVKQLNLMAQLDTVVEVNAKLMNRYAEDVVIETAQDLRYVTQSIIDAAKAKGQLAMMAQKYDSNEKDEERKNNAPLAGRQVGTALSGLIAGLDEEGRLALIDTIRKGTGSK